MHNFDNAWELSRDNFNIEVIESNKKPYDVPMHHVFEIKTKHDFSLRAAYHFPSKEEKPSISVSCIDNERYEYKESFSTAEFRILYPGAPSVINFNYISPSTTNFYARCWNYDNKKLTNFTGYTIYYEAYKSTEPTKVNVNTIDIVHDVESHDYSIASQANRTDPNTYVRVKFINLDDKPNYIFRVHRIEKN